MKLLFGPAPSNGQPSPPLPRHRLTEDEIDTLLTRMNAAVDDTPPATYRGQSPIGMVLEHFRTRTEPNRKA